MTGGGHVRQHCVQLRLGHLLEHQPEKEPELVTAEVLHGVAGQRAPLLGRHVPRRQRKDLGLLLAEVHVELSGEAPQGGGERAALLGAPDAVQAVSSVPVFSRSSWMASC